MSATSRSSVRPASSRHTSASFKNSSGDECLCTFFSQPLGTVNANAARQNSLPDLAIFSFVLTKADRRPRGFPQASAAERSLCSRLQRGAHAAVKPNSCVVTSDHPSTVSQVRSDRDARTHCPSYTGLRYAHLRVPGLRSFGKRGGAFRRRRRICGSRRNTCSDSD
jgi:hypothetical protein